MSPKVELSGAGVLALAGLVLAGGAVFVIGRWVYQHRQAFNPASDKNVVNQAVTSVVSSVAGRDTTLGGEIADIVFKIRHPFFDITAPVGDRVKPTINPPSATDTALAAGNVAGPW